MVKASLYFHIPFCTKKCDYCHFYVIPDKDPFKIKLMEGFKQEWKKWLPTIQEWELVSIYFGGGTPALMGADAIAEIISWIKPNKDIEITLEANPENITIPFMQAYAQAGVNRISIGIQTLDNGQLKTLGRIHSAEKGIAAIEATAAAGITNISIDLMYDLPGQTLDGWKNTLAKTRDLPITHLSLYNLTIEPHTVFFKFRESLQKQIPDPQVSLHMYEAAIEMLQEQGLQQYEISAFAKNNAYSRHNVGYWTARPFLGLGPSAFSYWNEERFRNVANLNKYCDALQTGKSPIDFSEKLEPDARRRELLVINLRLIAGVHLQDFQKLHGPFDKDTLSTIDRLLSESYLKLLGHQLSLTKQGILFYDTIAADLI